MNKSIVIVIIITAQNFLFTSLLMPMSAPKRIGVGLALCSSEILIPIWISEKFVIEPEFRIWRHKSSQSNDFELVKYRRIVKFGVGFFRHFTQEELSFYAGIRLSVSQDLIIEDFHGTTYDSEELTNTLVNFWFSPLLGAEYFVHERFSLGSEIQVNLEFTNNNADYYDLEESSNSIGTNTKIYIRFYLK